MAILKDAEGNEIDVLTKADLGDVIGQAVSQHLTGALRSQVPKILASPEVVGAIAEKLGLGDQVKKISEELEAMKQAKPPTNQTQQDTKSADIKIEDTPAFRALQQDFETKTARLQKQLDQAEAEKKREREQSRTQFRQQSAIEALNAAGIVGARAKQAFNHLLNEGRVKWASDDSDELLFVNDKAEELPLGAGIKGWAENHEEAKVYLPASGAAGSGGDPRRSAGAKASNNPFQLDPGVLGRALQQDLNT